ncbi:MAG TPA: NADH-ubiquinone oxidoreductase-F iron-sulfur binding region domain-containing protein [Streptomyces sp.]|nr:NADH-ubiquinone oxidoreductase-F iron-sulfur binding region domain-containing protein [Streptomyces sp.]
MTEQMARRLAVPPPTSAARLLAGWHDTGSPADLAEHLQRYGPPVSRTRRPSGLIEEVTAAGLLGRGGARFPAGRKLAAVAAQHRRPIVLANGCEGEPASRKDAALLALAPHLVLDGAVLAARALNAVEAVICVHEGATAVASLAAATAGRDDPVPLSVVEIPAHYVASQESALVRFLNTGDSRPTTTPPRPSERGIDGRPTFVANVETLAHIALIARFGATWFRQAGTREQPGTVLVTLDGAVRSPGVYELDGGTPIGTALHCAGGATAPLQAVLVGGYGGTWTDAPTVPTPPDSHAGMHTISSAPGVAVLLALPAGTCGLAQTAHLLRYLAAESARQCGPCTFGLPAITRDFAELVTGRPAAHTTLTRLRRRLEVIPGRGACAHPDGAVRLAASALETFAADLADHLGGRPCSAAGAPPLFPLPGRH